MHRNPELHQFLLSKAWKLTEDWYASLDKSKTAGVYASNDPEVIQNLKRQNYSFHEHLCDVFIKEEDSFFHDFIKWILEVAEDSQHLNTPIHIILGEFLNVQEQYLDHIDEFVSHHEGQYTNEEINRWKRMVIKTFGKVITRFVEENHNVSQMKLRSQQEVIHELSAPVIALQNQKGLLPIIGAVDTDRAQHLLEQTIKQCVEKRIQHLFIDLSGVMIVDTMVAMQIFRLIDSLKLVGVKTTLSGIRPEVAMTSIQLGLNFNDLDITSNLARALKE
ncbi:RsbT co-antagonist protein RsbRB [Domibacillus antri]|uniref:RsbT co-antagonist protein RsbRB n=1 Tax=Domibacillus antri TaxID=1714264 RepID=A0A1Q8Q388_9BACI|nr:STAS domain-containing protein [Domibacillus antri]OLN21741.1 RsbT co-antagonist protein RsbRB [Domibacillus antri]